MKTIACLLSAMLLSPSVQADPIRIAAIERVIDRAGLEGDVAVSFDGTAADYRYYGLLPSRPPNDDDGKLWRWASVTKQVVAVLVMQEVAAGRIDLDMPVATYLPGFTSANSRTATVRHLLRHQAGLPNPDDTGGAGGTASFYEQGYAGSRDPLTGYCAGTPKAAPGGNWTYNNCDYIVLGALLEAVTGARWDALVRTRITVPLGLTELAAYPTDRWTRPGLVEGKPEPAFELASFGAAAGLHGSIDDLLKFDLALMNGTLLAKPQLDEMWDGQAKLGYIALGQWVFEAKLKDCAQPVKIVERRGAIGGVELRNFILPDRKMAVVAMSHETPFAFGEVWQGTGFSHDLLNAAVCGAGMR